MRDLADTINMQHPLHQDGDIFISYAHEDWVEATKLYQLLKEKGCNVWLDDARLGCDGKGTAFDSRIRKAINQCNIFIPILSDQTRRDLEALPCKVADIDFSEAQGDARYYMKEWHYAQECKDNGHSFEVIPFTLGGYECGKNVYHVKVPPVISGATQFSAKDRDCISRILKEIDGFYQRNNPRRQ